MMSAATEVPALPADDTGLSANMHASVNGIVSEVTSAGSELLVESAVIAKPTEQLYEALM